MSVLILYLFLKVLILFTYDIKYKIVLHKLQSFIIFHLMLYCNIILLNIFQNLHGECGKKNLNC